VTSRSNAHAQSTGDQGANPFVLAGQVDPAVPTPESVIGYPVGDRAVRYADLVRYLQALDDASPLVSLTPYTETHEGRTLYYVTITSPANRQRLDAIKADNARLADPRKLPSLAEGDALVESLPGIAWMAYAIHGDELSSTDAAMQLVYQLAAGTDPATARLRDELVIHVDPLMNPDGRERYLSQLEHLTGKVPNPDYQAMQHAGLWSAGRGNHYLFDLNRDWLAQVHPETRGRSAAILEWNPHLVVDSHEMGPLETYLFDPPREPFNSYLSEGNLTWRRRFSADQAKAFDAHGWSYYTGDWYEEWYPGYTNAWANLLGAVGLLYEQAGVNGASVRQPTGELLTYHEAVHHQLVSSLANLETLRTHRREMLRDFLADRRWAVSPDGPNNETFLLPPPDSATQPPSAEAGAAFAGTTESSGFDRSTFNRFLEVLRTHGIEVQRADGPVEAADVQDIRGKHTDARTFPPGTWIVRSNQPHRRLLHAILAFDPHMSDKFLVEERTEIENHRGSKIYDVTAWNLAMAYGLDAYWAGRASASSASPAAPLPAPPRPALDDATAYGYLIDGADADVYPALVRLFDRECHVRVATKPFGAGDRSYAPGTLLLRRHENPPDLARRLEEAAAGLNLDILPVRSALSRHGPDLGGDRFSLLQAPRVAIASQWPVDTTSFGWIWYLLDVRCGLRCSPIDVHDLGGIDLRKYNVLVLPNASASRLAAVVDEEAVEDLRSWIEAGGTLIAVGGSAAFAADPERSLSAVRLKQDVLDQRAVYDEDLRLEAGARNVQVDPDAVWGTSAPSDADDDATSAPTTGSEDEDAEKPDVETRKRLDERQQAFHPQGVFVGASLNPDHWLCFGVPRLCQSCDRTAADAGAGGAARLPVLIAGTEAFMARQPVEVPVRLLGENELRLSGLMWPEARRRWADTVYAAVESAGHGQIILFAGEPAFRGYCEGTGRLLLNALLLGPGVGTSPPVPW